MHTLWITEYDSENRVNAVRALKAVRAARAVLGDRLGSTLARSYELLRQAEATLPMLVGEHEDRAVIDEAARTLEVESSGVLRAEIDLSEDATASYPRSEDDDLDDTDYVGRTALTLMAFAGGNPVTAMLYAATLHRNAGDPEFYEGVIECLGDAFPAVEQ